MWSGRAEPGRIRCLECDNKRRFLEFRSTREVPILEATDVAMGSNVDTGHFCPMANIVLLV